MTDYIIMDKGKKSKEDVKSPDGKAILEYMTDHIKVNPDELRLMLNITDAKEELEVLSRAGFIRREGDGGW